MEQKQFLEAGVIAATHGLKGEMRIYPWSDSPQFLCGLKRIYIDGKEYRFTKAAPHKSMVLCALEGIEDLREALALKGKTIFINRADVVLEKGRYFIQDLIGLEVIDQNRGSLGKIDDVQNLPANDVYFVRGPEQNYRIPAVPAFIKNVDLVAGIVETEVIEGMEE